MPKAKNTLIAGTLGLALLAASVSVAQGRDTIKPADYELDLNQASAIALQQVPGAIQEAELDKEDGIVIWEIEITGADEKRYELNIDANNGNVISKKLDDGKRKGGKHCRDKGDKKHS